MAFLKLGWCSWMYVLVGDNVFKNSTISLCQVNFVLNSKGFWVRNNRSLRRVGRPEDMGQVLREEPDDSADSRPVTTARLLVSGLAGDFVLEQRVPSPHDRERGAMDFNNNN